MGGVLATLRRRRGEKSGLTSLELWFVVGHEFCVVRSRIFQEVWVSDFASLKGKARGKRAFGADPDAS